MSERVRALNAVDLFSTSAVFWGFFFLSVQGRGRGSFGGLLLCMRSMCF